MKTFTKIAALGALSLGFAVALLGCENNDANVMKNAEGQKTAPGAMNPQAPTSSQAAFEAQKKNDPLQSDEYKKATGQK